MFGALLGAQIALLVRCTRSDRFHKEHPYAVSAQFPAIFRPGCLLFSRCRPLAGFSNSAFLLHLHFVRALARRASACGRMCALVARAGCGGRGVGGHLWLPGLRAPYIPALQAPPFWPLLHCPCTASTLVGALVRVALWTAGLMRCPPRQRPLPGGPPRALSLASLGAPESLSARTPTLAPT